METQTIDRVAETSGTRRVAELSVADLFRTSDSLASTILRMALAVVLFPHGAQHLLGWFGGYGYAGTHEWMIELGFPGPLATAAIVTEFVAPLALAIGVVSRAAAAGVVGLMIGAASVHLPNGFFMNWFGALPAGTEGYEYHILMGTMAVAVAIAGAGRWSADHVIRQRLARVVAGRRCAAIHAPQ